MWQTWLPACLKPFWPTSVNCAVRPSAAGYARDVGPGVYDIHSPVVPSVEWIAAKLRSFVEVSCLTHFCASREKVCVGWAPGSALQLPCLHNAS